MKKEVKRKMYRFMKPGTAQSFWGTSRKAQALIPITPGSIWYVRDLNWFDHLRHRDVLIGEEVELTNVSTGEKFTTTHGCFMLNFAVCGELINSLAIFPRAKGRSPNDKRIRSETEVRS